MDSSTIRKIIALLTIGNFSLFASCSTPHPDLGHGSSPETIPLAKPADDAVESTADGRPTFYALGDTPIISGNDEPVYRSINVFRQPENIEELIAATIADRERSQAAVTPTIVAGESPELEFFSYVVKEGDTLLKISRNHKTTVAEIMRINGLESDEVHPGDRLSLPRAD